MKHINLSESNEREWEGVKATEDDYDVLIQEDTQIMKPDGSLLCIVLKRAMDVSKTAQAWNILKDENFVSTNRGKASGEERFYRVKNDGTVSNTNYADPVNSGIVGFFERTPRFPYCRACAWNLTHPEKWAALMPMLQEVDGLFKRYAQQRYHAQALSARKAHKDFLIPGTHFSTLTINKNFRTAYHRDAGNLPEGISCMSVIRQGKWSGANLVFPKYRVAAKLDSLDLIIFDPHEVHGNTPLVKLTPNAVRCSIVYYFREKIQFCQSAEEELRTVQNRKQGEQLFKTILRRKESDESVEDRGSD